MFDYTIITPKNFIESRHDLGEIADFLFVHLEQYGDKREDIMKCIHYALSEEPGFGGFITIARDKEKNEITGVVIINETGMEGYIPENLLVYIAVHGGYRGKGLGKSLMKKVMAEAKGDIALHVEPDNPARYLYEKLGFMNKYLEMRYKS